MIEAVIFDVDGTLVDSVDFHAEAWERAFARHGHDIAFAALRAQIGKGGDQLMPEFLSGDRAEARRPGDRGGARRHLQGGLPRPREGFPGLRRPVRRAAEARAAHRAGLLVEERRAEGLQDGRRDRRPDRRRDLVRRRREVEAASRHLPGRARRAEARARPCPGGGRHALRRRRGPQGRRSRRSACSAAASRRPTSAPAARPGSTATPPTSWPTSTSGPPLHPPAREAQPDGRLMPACRPARPGWAASPASARSPHRGDERMARPRTTAPHRKLCGSTSTATRRLPVGFGPSARMRRRKPCRSAERVALTSSRKR